MDTQPTYIDLLRDALAAEFGFDPGVATERELVAAQVIVNRRERARWLASYIDRVHCRAAHDSHDLLELVARRDWPHPLL